MKKRTIVILMVLVVIGIGVGLAWAEVPLPHWISGLGAVAMGFGIGCAAGFFEARYQRKHPRQHNIGMYE